MANKLFVAVLGYQNSGKTTTWKEIFGGPVKTSKKPRDMALFNGESAKIFLINGSPDERNVEIDDLIGGVDCQIILCSVQYIEKSKNTFKFIRENGFDIFVQWLNPGFGEGYGYFDQFGLLSWLAWGGATISIRNGNEDPKYRVREIKDFIYGWAKSRNITY